jgi:ribosomal protein S18 acetylase RimI-like enzyme
MEGPMAEEYRIACTDSPEDADFTVIGLGIRSYNEQQAGVDGHRRLCLFLHAPDDTVVGGLTGSTYFNWFSIDLLWVKEEHRGQGHGQRLLALAEQEARQRGAKGAYLDTFSFQAPDLYRRNGYEVFGILQDFPEGHQRYYFRKQL